ncbi:MAG: glycoside hydrolase family 15 protein [Acidimicrobiia bacterium]
MPFSPIRRLEGYLPIEDHGLIGDGATAVLVGRDGAISWMCVPRFDSPPLFAGLLDRRVGGFFRVGPEDLLESRQQYLPDTGVLVTELRGRSGLVRVTDALVLGRADLAEEAPATRRQLLRLVEVLSGELRLEIEVAPPGPFSAEQRGGGWSLRAERPDLDIHLSSSHPLDGPRCSIELEQGDRLHLLLDWSGRPPRGRPEDPDALLESTASAWRGWLTKFAYRGPREALVRRSAITLKLLDHFENGAIVAAPTSSLPEHIGGNRNWDYRYSWVRDAAFSVYAMRRIGLIHEAVGFLSWVLEAVERSGGTRVLYDVEGNRTPAEREDPALEGYRGSRPVRWGNAAADQEQHDAYGEIIDCAYQWMLGGGHIDRPLWARLQQLVEAARRNWNKPGRGIWEVRTPGRVFTYSAALCHVALDRAALIAEQAGLPGEVKPWREAARRIARAILEQGWNAELGTLTAELGGEAVDASLLALPMRRLLRADHPRMVATTETVRKHLDAGGGLLYRYLPRELPDGMPPGEGAFLLCSFWLVDNLAHQGRIDEAEELYEAMCDRANPLGLLPEEIDPASGAFLGNFPQALSHVGLISSGFELASLTGQMENRTRRTSPSSTT